MIYTAIASPSETQDLSFSRRKIPNLTQSKMGMVTIYGKASFRELAYDGYKANIDAFVSATSNNEVVYCGNRGTPLAHTLPTVPLPLPKIIFTFARTPTQEQLTKVTEGLKAYNFLEHHASKKTKTYTVDFPPWDIIESKIMKIASPTSPTQPGYMTIQGAMALLHVYKVVDSFLATNSYPYSRTLTREEPAYDSFEEQEGLKHVYTSEASHNKKHLLTFLRPDLPVKRICHSDGITGDNEEWSSAYDATVLGEDEDLPDDVDQILDEVTPYVHSEVVKAKPSPLPSSINFGGPGDVPFLPGHFFPYFDGLLATDATFLRTSMLSNFFRTFSERYTGDPRQGYVNFKDAIRDTASTQQGKVASHVLKGIELALDTQTRLFLIISGIQYLGFCLLGGANSIYVRTGWVDPLDSEALQKELASVSTHRSTLSDLAAKLSSLSIVDGTENEQVNAEEIDTSFKLAHELGRRDWTGAKGKDAELEVIEMMRSLSFPRNYRPLSVKHILIAIEELTFSGRIPRETNIYLVSSGLSRYSDEDFIIFCSFGTEAFSFRSASGKEFRLPADIKHCPNTTVFDRTIMVKDKEVKISRMPQLVIAVKPVSQCHQDWNTLLKRKSIKQDLGERAKDFRCMTYSQGKKDKAFEEIWSALAKLVEPSEDEEEGGEEVPDKVIQRGFGVSSIDDIF